MPKWLGKVLGIGTGAILILGATRYWYVFIAGAPQLDPTGYFNDQSGQANSPKYLVKKLFVKDKQRLRAYLDAGEGDKEFLTSTQQFHEQLNRFGVANEFNTFPSGHGIVGHDVGWNYWHKHLADSLSYVGKQFKISLAAQKN